VYTGNVIEPATTFSAAAGGTGDASLPGTVTTLAALLRVENHQSVQRAILYAALSAQPPVLSPDDLASLREADVQARSDLADFNASANTTEQESYSTVVSGRAVDDDATSQKIEAEQQAAASPSAPLTGATGLDAATWYGNMSTTVGDTRKVAGQLAGQITVRADTLKSNATRSLLFTSIVALLLVILLLSAALARFLARPLGKLRADALDAVTR
jgi:nitrate/nitrite sensing protein